MASLITAKELDAKIAEMQEARKNMTQPEHRVCPVCLSLYVEDQRKHQTCWCDYDSPCVGGDD